MSLEVTQNEDIINEIVPVSRGDDGLLEGAAIGDDLELLDVGDSSDSDNDEEGIVIHAGRTSSNRRPSYKQFASGSKLYHQRTPGKDYSSTPAKEIVQLSKEDEELKKLRFNRHITAFDVDINALEEHPWRNKNVDLLDYFNYGFNEKSWQQYCAKQLRIRAQKGLGPHLPVPSKATPSAVAAGSVQKESATSSTVVPSSTAPTQAFIPPSTVAADTSSSNTATSFSGSSTFQVPSAHQVGGAAMAPPTAPLVRPPPPPSMIPPVGAAVPSWPPMPPAPHFQQMSFPPMPHMTGAPLPNARPDWQQGRLPPNMPQPPQIQQHQQQPQPQPHNTYQQQEQHQFYPPRSDFPDQVRDSRQDYSQRSSRESLTASARVNESSSEKSFARNSSTTADSSRQDRVRADSRDREKKAVTDDSSSSRRRDSRDRESGGSRTAGKGSSSSKISSSSREVRRDSRERERDRDKKPAAEKSDSRRRDDPPRSETRHEGSSSNSRSSKRHRDSRSRSRSNDQKRKR